jgi:hypothetical protein
MWMASAGQTTAAWIGMRGLHAALRAHDGRAGGSPALLKRLTAHFGRPSELVALVYAAGSAAHHFASFAPAVGEAARDGDPVARRIWAEAGRQLGQTALAAASGLEPVFSWGGRLFDAADLLMEPFQSTVRTLLPEARFEPPRGGSADGALTLARGPPPAVRYGRTTPMSTSSPRRHRIGWAAYDQVGLNGAEPGEDDVMKLSVPERTLSVCLMSLSNSARSPSPNGMPTPTRWRRSAS